MSEPVAAHGTFEVTCRRPGCERAATVAISYHADTCQIRVSGVSGERLSDDGAQPLCADHAERFHAPTGWVVIDERSPLRGAAVAPRASEARSPLPTPRVRTVLLPRAWGRFDAPNVEFCGEQQSSPQQRELAVPAARQVHMTEAFAKILSEPTPTVVRQRAPEPVVEPVREPAVETVVEPDAVPAPRPHEAPAVTWETPIVAAHPIVIDQPIAEPPVVGPSAISAPPEQAAPASPDRARPRRTRPAADVDDDPLLKPKGRMLSRAFGATGHQRTVLSDPLGTVPTPEATPPAPEPTPDTPT